MMVLTRLLLALWVNIVTLAVVPLVAERRGGFYDPLTIGFFFGGLVLTWLLAWQGVCAMGMGRKAKVETPEPYEPKGG